MARKTPPKTTTLEDDTLDAPQSTSAGDAPADTYDATEYATSQTPDKGAAAAAGHQSVNAVGLLPPRPAQPEPEARTETYTAVRPDGTEVTVTRNIVTGETEVTEPEPPVG